MTAGATWVFHRGALGDGVLLWPMLRAMRREGREVTLVTNRSKGLLAAAETGIVSVDAEQARFNRLWRAGTRPETVGGAARVIWFGETWPDEACAVWESNARAMFPGAELTRIPGRPDAPFAREWTERGGRAEPRVNPHGPIVCHVGAGSESKRWPVARWVRLAAAFSGAGAPSPRLVAGEVERDRFSRSERDVFLASGGVFSDDLGSLADLLRCARLVIAVDCGPAHLAAQLGVPTLSLFGPTDPGRWAPVGPRVRVLAPASPSAMEWLAPERVLEEAMAILRIP